MTRVVLALLLVAAPAAQAQVTGPIPVSGTTRTLNAGPGAQTSISGVLVSFERTLAGATNADFYVFDVGSNTLFQLQSTPDVDEDLNDISVIADGTVHVVWAHSDPLNPADGARPDRQ